jgi:hypothetical protein
MPGFVESVIVEIRDAALEILKWIQEVAATLPTTLRSATTTLAIIVAACAVIGLAILAVTMLLGMVFVHPRPTVLSSRTAWDDYVDGTFLPHFLLLRKQLEADAGALASRGVAHLFPAVDTAVFPRGDADCATFVKNYFRCHSAYDSKLVLFGKAVFELPEDANERVEKDQWQRVQGFRAQLRRAAERRDDGLWMTQAAYGAQRTRGPLHAAMRGAGADYNQYVDVARIAARASAVALELDLLFNTYLPDIVQRYDSRHRKVWGNNYIIYYFMKDTTQVTADNIESIWKNWGNNILFIAHTIESFWRSLGEYCFQLPMYLIRSTLQ